MRILALLLAAALSACSKQDKWADNVATPPLNVIAEAPGDWTALDGMIGRRPSESGLVENSPISVDLEARLGPDAQTYRNAMMRSGPLQRSGLLMVSKGPDAWLVIDPEQHAFRAGLLREGRWQDWHTAGTDLPRPL
ncbi:hypothetical protein [Sphingomonas humi]|uniref:Lipoprotein n=1 Tax=Sphingomonas humi TaxID=335630 RepID=A0ABP7RQL8_9SPHN